MGRSYFHLHLVSDATGETLIAVSRAPAAQYRASRPSSTCIRSCAPKPSSTASWGARGRARDGALHAGAAGLARRLEEACREYGCPCLSVLDPVLAFSSPIWGPRPRTRPGAQHVLDADYFKRIDALELHMMHDDGALPPTSRRPTSSWSASAARRRPRPAIYLANRGIKTANIPLVPGIPLPPGLERGQEAARRRAGREPRAHRADPAEPALALNASARHALCRQDGRDRGSGPLPQAVRAPRWPLIDVTRRSMRKPPPAIMDL